VDVFVGASARARRYKLPDGETESAARAAIRLRRSNAKSSRPGAVAFRAATSATAATIAAAVVSAKELVEYFVPAVERL
jgi:hypothetical protein